jgi:hypothetical protein
MIFSPVGGQRKGPKHNIMRINLSIVEEDRKDIKNDREEQKWRN